MVTAPRLPLPSYAADQIRALHELAVAAELLQLSIWRPAAVRARALVDAAAAAARAAQPGWAARPLAERIALVQAAVAEYLAERRTGDRDRTSAAAKQAKAEIKKMLQGLAR